MLAEDPAFEMSCREKIRMGNSEEESKILFYISFFVLS